MTATTALTAQNTLGVYDIHHTPPSFVSKQIDACIDDIGVDVVKIGTPFLVLDQTSFSLLPPFRPSNHFLLPIGMLASAKTIDAVARALERHGKPTCVLDPVCKTCCRSFPQDLTDAGHGRDKWCSTPTLRSGH